jgi:hypothetical protein
MLETTMMMWHALFRGPWFCGVKIIFAKISRQGMAHIICTHFKTKIQGLQVQKQKK